ncbi:hypothetical protein [Romboutsia sp. 1001713B170131_170501_G6]|uniref:hypothetical protein n=1 Tax=Romboutsia sp. 1001713B170131_170501_G6 TaxID=2787108 RepID=UPI0018A99197|nr:hypothetical protein [Romboutsia sp. 1001713B170131_170501_G6]
MKRAITALSVLCGGMLFVSPINNIIFAQSSNNKPKVEAVENINTNKKEEVNNIDKQVIKNESNNKVHNEIAKVENKEEVKKQDNIKKDNNNNKINKQENNQLVKEENTTNSENVIAENVIAENTQKTEDNKVQEENVLVSNDKVQPDIKEESKVEVINVLNKEQAKDLLKMYNKDANYTYQGDENSFSALKEKGLSGYVFLPDYDTDLGFFVDKNTSNIYYFHPSGYLELVM